MRWTTLFIAACWALAADATAWSAPRTATPPRAMPPHAALRDTSCVRCHAAERSILSGRMATRTGEREFARRAFGREGDAFFAQSCNGCHVRSCDDCHRDGKVFVAKPADTACLRCHHGDNVGWDYHGRAAREDHERYQRGAIANGQRVLKMIPDIHQQKGMTCASCHDVHALHEGRGRTKSCRECHPKPDASVPEHAITAHLDRMQCSSCHSAWASQEYGTFLVRPRGPEKHEAFEPLPSWGEWKKSGYLRLQDAPPLGLDAQGLVSPIRPRYLLFATDERRGWENRRLAAEWRAFFPHTVRRGTVTCTGCHDAPRRFLLEADEDRRYRPDEDGLPLKSFWNTQGQTLVNGRFFPRERFDQMNRRTPQYVREHLKQWQGILRHVEGSSSH